MGSWKIIEMRLPRTSAIWLSLKSLISSPSIWMLSASMRLVLSLSRRMTASELTDLPEPDSPTRPKVLPANTSKSMPCTASFHFPSREKETLRLRTISKGVDIM